MNQEKPKSLFEVAREVRREYEEELAKTRLEPRSAGRNARSEPLAVIDADRRDEELDNDNMTGRAAA